MISTVLALDTTKYLIKETDYMPWESALSNLDFFYLMFDRNEVYGPMQVGFLTAKHISNNEKKMSKNTNII